MSLAVILVNWRNERETVRCANALKSWRQPKPQLIVVDNESTQRTREALSSALAATAVISSPENLGYGGGNNLGIRDALAAGCEYILLLNSDAELPEESASRLLNRLQSDPSICILGPAIREGQNADELLIGGRDIVRHPLSRMKIGASVKSRSPLRRVDYVPGTVFLARAALFRDIGLLDEQYFFSGEIADFCRRARDRGHESFVDVEAQARHRPELRSLAARDVLYTYYALRNRFLYVKKHHVSARHLYFAYWTMIAALMLVRALARAKPAKARAIGLAVVHAYTGRFGNQNASFARHGGRTERA